MRPLPLILAKIALLLPLPAIVRADVICIHNQTEFSQILTNAAAVGGDLQLHLQQGSYSLDGTIVTVFPNANPMPDMQISGGYFSNCTMRANDPQATSVSVDTTLAGATWKLAGDFSTDNLTLRGPITLKMFGGGIHNVSLARTRIAESAFPQTVTVLAATAADSLQVHAENIVAFKNTPGAVVDCALKVQAFDSVSSLIVVQSTLANFNQCGVRISGIKTAKFYNNIFWNLGTAGVIEAANSPLQADSFFVANIIAARQMLKTPIVDFTSTNVNPMFTAPLSDLHIVNGSPAINTGNPGVPGGMPATDYDGNPRVIGSTADRGAYETPFSDNGVISVVNTNDSGTGSLRQAIKDSKLQNIPITIKFNIPGTCPQKINLVTPLEAIGKPQITIIDGYSQPGSLKNSALFGDNATICVFVSGQNSVSFALTNDAVTAKFSISGLAFGGFTDAAIKLGSTGAITIAGNLFGHGMANEPAGWLPSHENIRLEGGTQNAIIGGADKGDRNLLNSSTSRSLGLSSGSNVQVINNYIGLDADGITARPNLSQALAVFTPGNTISGNFISGNSFTGITIAVSGNNNVFSGNAIGVQDKFCLGNCNFALPNGNAGISIAGGSGNQFNNNRIAHNGTSGIEVLAQAGPGNRFSGNRISANTGLGIDIQGPFGVNPIDVDPLDPATAANAGQNFPVIRTAGGMTSSGAVTGRLFSRNGSFRIEAFASSACDASGYGEGELPVGAIADVAIADATANANGTADFTLPITINTTFDGKFITLIATDANGNSSEFSACALYNDRVFANDFE